MSARRFFVRPRKHNSDSSSDSSEDSDGPPLRRRHRNEGDADMLLLMNDSTGTSTSLVEAVKWCERHLSSPAHPFTPALSPDYRLKDYQKEGVDWLMQRLSIENVGILLADEMGLGKTLEALATLSLLLPSCGPHATALVMAPLSVIEAWMGEVRSFVPQLRVLRFIGTKDERQEMVDGVEEDLHSAVRAGMNLQAQFLPLRSYDILLTTPEILMGDIYFISKLEFSCIVVDEAHRLKNDSSKLYRLMSKQFSTVRHRMLLTGTPVHGNLQELFALLRFANPRLLGAIPRCDLSDTGAPELMQKLCSHLMLRRLKQDVLKDLPPLNEVVVEVPLSPLQRELYRKILHKDIHNLFGATKMTLMNTVMQLRKCALHPYLFPGMEPEPFELGEHVVQQSGKLACLDKVLTMMKGEDHRVLIFSQFTLVLDVLQDYFYWRNWKCCRLDGTVRGETRFETVASFQNDADVFAFLISTRSGGVGLTLTAADVVVFFDSDWNPQMDLQAQQRAHRIGQTRPVTVYRFVAKNTVEDAMLRRAHQKLRLAQTVLQPKAMENTELAEMLKIGVGALFSPVQTEEEWKHWLSQQTGNGLLSSATRTSFQSVSAGLQEGVYEFEGSDYSENVRRGGEYLSDLLQQTRQRRRAEDEENEEPRPTSTIPLLAPARQRRTEQDRLEKLKPKWEQNSYTSHSLPLEGVDETPLTRTGDTETEDDDDDGRLSLVHVRGDIRHPSYGSRDATRILFFPINNSGKWGRGGLFKVFENIAGSLPQYYEMAKENADLRLGDLHLIPALASKSILVAMAIVQRSSTQSASTGGAVDFKAADLALRRLYGYVVHHASSSQFSFHLPHVGTRKESYTVEKLVAKWMIPIRVPSFMYYYDRAEAARQPVAAACPQSPVTTRKPTLAELEKSFIFYGFTSVKDERTEESRRLVLVHGGVMCSLEDVKDPSFNPADYVIVVPKSFSVQQSELAEYEAKGCLIVRQEFIFQCVQSAERKES